ncbi:tetratricopeptide repeat protein [Qipengyuania sp.]|uniref:tetratricopeptide repeat protein n=1 Tax=Qipengyuania sp. TaxID=2004515 RepID=UPI0035C7B2CA
MAGTKQGGMAGKAGVLALGIALAALVAALAFKGGDSDSESEPTTAAAEPADTIAGLEAQVARNADDEAAWRALGFARYDAGDYWGAAEAYERATALDPENAVLWSALGEARVMASERDPMPPAALVAFRKAAALDPKDPRARYFLAVKRDLDGDHAGAVDDWLALLKDTPRAAPWEADLRRTIQQVGKINGIETQSRLAEIGGNAGDTVLAEAAAPVLTAGAAIPGPSQQDIAAARAMSPSQQHEMAEGMVASLEAKLRANPGNVDGWVMLMRSRATLGQPDLALKALADARAANPGAAARLSSEAKVLGIR